MTNIKQEKKIQFPTYGLYFILFNNPILRQYYFLTNFIKKNQILLILFLLKPNLTNLNWQLAIKHTLFVISY